MPEVSYAGETLTVAGESVRFPHPIDDVVEVDGVIVVRLAPPADAEDEERNVVAVDSAGNRLWTVQRATDGFRTPRHYTHVTYDDESERLLATNWNGYRYEIDVDTGSISTLGKHTK